MSQELPPPSASQLKLRVPIKHPLLINTPATAEAPLPPPTPTTEAFQAESLVLAKEPQTVTKRGRERPMKGASPSLPPQIKKKPRVEEASCKAAGALEVTEAKKKRASSGGCGGAVDTDGNKSNEQEKQDSLFRVPPPPYPPLPPPPHNTS